MYPLDKCPLAPSETFLSQQARVRPTTRVEGLVELIAISVVLSAVHAPVAVVASGVVVDVGEGHGRDVEKLESD